MNKAFQDKLYFHGITVSIIIALTVITYLNCLPNLFVYDDVSTITENRFIKDWGNFPALFTHDYFKYSGELTYRPFVTLSYFIDYSLWHENPMGYHVVNVVLHTLIVTLIYFLALLLFQQYSKHITQHSHSLVKASADTVITSDVPSRLPQSPIVNPIESPFTKGGFGKVTDQFPRTSIAFLTSILFAVHPIVSEVVNGISYREDLIAMAFLIVSFLLFLLCKERVITQIPLTSSSGRNGGFSLSVPSRKGTATLYTAAMAAYFFSLLSKESAIVLPALIFFFDLIFNTHARVNGISSLLFSVYKTISTILRSSFFLGYIGISMVYLVIRFFILHNPHEKIAYPEGSFFINMITMTKVLGRYITNIFLPLNLNADYHVLYLKTPLTLSFIIPLFMLLSIAIIVVRLRKKRVIVFAILWFFISILPVLNVIPLANIMADRYLYLPILGFCLLLSTTLLHLRISIRHPLVVSLILFYVVITVSRNNIWRDEFSLWHRSSQSSLCSFTTYNNLGTQYNKKGYPDAALRYYQKALQKAKEVGFIQYATVYYNIGNAYEKKGLQNQAATAYEKAIRMKLDYHQAHNNLGKVYFTQGRYDDAIAEYNTAITIDPNFAYAYNNLGVLYNKLGRQEDAVSAYKKALSLDPHYGDAYYNLGNIYEIRKEYDLALEAYQNALKVDPSQVYVHNNLGTIYDKKGHLEDAIAEYKQAIRLDPAYPYSYNNLGASLTKKGDIDGALIEFQKAADLLPNQPDFHFNIGYTYLKKGDLDSALKKFEATRKLAPSHAEALFCIGTIYHRQGDKEKAEKSWQAVLELNPNHAKAKKCLEMLTKQ